MHRSVPQLMLIVLLLGLVLIRESREQPLLGFEESFVNWLAANCPRSGTPAPLVLVEINDSSMENQHPWPWSPLDFALFLEDALQFKPAALAIEPVPEWNPKELSSDAQLKYPQFLKILHDRILLAPKIVLAAQLGFPEDPDVIPPLQPVPVLRRISGNPALIPEFTTIEREPMESLRLAAALGYTNLPLVQEPVRSAPLVFRYRGQVVPSFVLQSLMMWYQITPDEVDVEVGTQIILRDKIKIPIDATGGMLVDFKSPYTRVGFEELLLAVEQTQAKAKPVLKPEVIANKLVVLARTDSGARTYHLPIGRKGSEGELFASAIATVQNHAFIRHIGIWFQFVLIAVIMLMLWLLYQRPRQHAAPIAGLFLMLYVMVALALFATSEMAMPFSLPVGLAMLVVALRISAPPEDFPAPAT